MGRSHGIRAEITSLSAASVSGIKAARTMLIGSSKEQENLPADVKRECRISANWRTRQRVSKRWSRGGLTRSSDLCQLKALET
ncbi:MAG: hypothetical protein WHS63_07980 [Tenuifilum sp.]|uniref:hypothetical protein n=1 Tax=Tenuifilum sp. TaxID=2760880 RepID=UPI0030951C70